MSNTQSKITPATLISAERIVVSVNSPTELVDAQKRLFDIGAGWHGSTINALNQEIETNLIANGILLSDTGKMSFIAHTEHDDHLEALFISTETLLSTSLTPFKLKIEAHKNKVLRKEKVDATLDLLQKLPAKAITDDIMLHINELHTALSRE